MMPAAGAPVAVPAPPLLEVEGLTVSFAQAEGRVAVVEDVGFTLGARTSLGLVGESGCGKSVTAMSLLRLLPMPPARIERGRAWFDGVDLLTLAPDRLRRLRGNRVGVVFQEPMTSLNPTMTVGHQVAEVLRLHKGAGADEARRAAVAMLGRVGVGAPERRLDQYPHQLSGGLRQRVMIAMALICRPALLIADEPTTALDVTIQAQILELLRCLGAELGLAVLLITHDLGVVAEVCDEVAVMYAGRVVERSSVRSLFRCPRHPYTQGLMASSPRGARRGARLPMIPGMVPAPGRRGPGCAFAERCPRALDRCRVERPPLAAIAPAHEVACWNPAP
jgi:oligopeptide/dipeptide ABC transporter ATP-binding protein